MKRHVEYTLMEINGCVTSPLKEPDNGLTLNLPVLSAFKKHFLPIYHHLLQSSEASGTKSGSENVTRLSTKLIILTLVPLSFPRFLIKFSYVKTEPSFLHD